MWPRRAQIQAARSVEELEGNGEIEEIPLLATGDKGAFPASSPLTLKENDVHLTVRPVDEDTPEGSDSADPGDGWGPYPTEDERHGPRKLRRIGGPISWPAFLIAFVELCERFSYFGTTAVFINYLQRPLPPNSPTGSNPIGTPGALGLGTNAATAITQLNTLWVYVVPLFGAYIADTRLGRFRTVCWSVGIAMIGHIAMIFASLPSVMPHPSLALTIFILSLLVMGLGTGGFKANVSPLVAEQQGGPTRLTVVRDQEGERVILDPSITTARIYMYFYLMINIGAGVGQLFMTFAEKYVGFWMAFTAPTVMFCLCPFVLWWGHSLYTKSPPSGSILLVALRVFHIAFSPLLTLSPRRFWRAWNDPRFWERAKPSSYSHSRSYSPSRSVPLAEEVDDPEQEQEGQEGPSKPSWMIWDDAFVDEVRRGAAACAVFLFYPFYWISFNQMNSTMTSQAATMITNGVPNDVIENTNPVALMILIPVFDKYIYPYIRRRYNFTPLKRIFAGFIVASIAMIWAGILQWYIYTASPCGYGANDPSCEPAPISVWWQTGAYVLVAISEIFASITGLEYAFTKAPKSMKSVVMALFLSTSAVASILGWVLNPLAGDPLLIWNYVVCFALSFGAGIVFWVSFRKLDEAEDRLNEIGQDRPPKSEIEDGEEDV